MRTTIEQHGRMHVLALEKIAVRLRRGSKRACAHTQGQGPLPRLSFHIPALVLPRFGACPSTLRRLSFHASTSVLPRFRACPSTLITLPSHATGASTSPHAVTAAHAQWPAATRFLVRGHKRAQGISVSFLHPTKRTRETHRAALVAACTADGAMSPRVRLANTVCPPVDTGPVSDTKQEALVRGQVRVPCCRVPVDASGS